MEKYIRDRTQGGSIKFRNILSPSSYQVGQDTLPFVAALSPLVENMNLLAAIRFGEPCLPTLARTLATIDDILEGRLTLSIISSDLPDDQLESEKKIPKVKRSDRNFETRLDSRKN